ncbi:hypothetical protein OO006_10795 [Prosthecochloris sp. SCSIO W1101]|uniref:hypothetical protein n=1 Tax=Prosthecochloris sp. SCSIO W1101 TaxID=2992242 RepID=UPI00223DB1E4|nr:hypothetical protein [Prosthecochloris sp. SCSIO W1101]UZJ40834.1 hypothetical protein OO006_10795 [Prosthecochloris sp. SCSIO W1101]
MFGFHRDAVYNPRESHAALDAASMEKNRETSGSPGSRFACPRMTEKRSPRVTIKKPEDDRKNVKG